MKICNETECRNVVSSLNWCRKHATWHGKRKTREYKRRMTEAGQLARHGTRRRYSKGCRCKSCAIVESEYRAAWRLRTGRTRTSKIIGP